MRHSPPEKVSQCFLSLEVVSDDFSSFSRLNDNVDWYIDADALLEPVCWHIVVVKLERLHAVITFAKVYTGYDHLLRGMKWYA